MSRIQFKLGVPHAGSSARLAEDAARGGAPAGSFRIAGGTAARLAEEAARAARSRDDDNDDGGPAPGVRGTGSVATSFTLRGQGGHVSRLAAPIEHPAAHAVPAAKSAARGRFDPPFDTPDAAQTAQSAFPQALQRQSLGAAVHLMFRRLTPRSVPSDPPE